MAHGLLLGGRIDQHRSTGCRVRRPPGRLILGCREERRIHVHGDAQNTAAPPVTAIASRRTTTSNAFNPIAALSNHSTWRYAVGTARRR